MPTTRAPDQPKITTVFAKKKRQRAEDNDSKTAAPRGPKPKKKEIIDADNDAVIIETGDRTQIDLTILGSPEKEKPDPDFDISKSEGNKAVEPKFDPDATDDEMPNQDATDDDMSVDNDTKAIDLTLRSPEKPKLTYYDMSKLDKVVEPEVDSMPKVFVDVASVPSKLQKEVDVVRSIKVLAEGNWKFGIDPLHNPTPDALLNQVVNVWAPRIQDVLDLDELPCLKWGASTAVNGVLARATAANMYDRGIYRWFATVSYGLTKNQQVIDCENNWRRYKNSLNLNGSNGLDNLGYGDNNSIRITVNEENEGVIYVAIPHGKFKTAKAVRGAIVALKREKAKEGERIRETDGRRIRSDADTVKVTMGSLLNLLLNSKLDIDDVHEAFLHLGSKRINDLCKSDPDLMKARGVSTNFIDPHGWAKLVAEYVEMFPDRKDTLGWIPNATPLEPGKFPIGYSKLFAMERPKLFVRAVDELVTRKYLVQIRQSNPIRFGPMPGNPKWHRYEKYKKAKTVAEMLKFGASKYDIADNVKAGFVKLVKPP